MAARGLGERIVIPVLPPYRLDYTAEALRRTELNLVDAIENGSYHRALSDARGSALVRVRQLDDETLEMQASGRDAARWVPQVARMLGTQVDLSVWRRRSAKVAWVRPLARAFDGLKPPRYASLWEACAHAIVFSQISLHAGAAIMSRLVAKLGESVEVAGVRAIPFPAPERLLRAREETLRGVGLSRNKVGYLRGIAEAVLDGTLDEQRIESLPTAEASELVMRARGLGPWCAAVVMLRGFGRIDTFPLRDSGVARSVARVANDPALDLGPVLDVLGPARGMLYYHLLLSRLHPLS